MGRSQAPRTKIAGVRWDLIKWGMASWAAQCWRLRVCSGRDGFDATKGSVRGDADGTRTTVVWLSKKYEQDVKRQSLVVSKVRAQKPPPGHVACLESPAVRPARCGTCVLQTVANRRSAHLKLECTSLH